MNALAMTPWAGRLAAQKMCVTSSPAGAFSEPFVADGFGVGVLAALPPEHGVPWR